MSDAMITVLWFDGDAEEAATFYAAIFPDSTVGASCAHLRAFPAADRAMR